MKIVCVHCGGRFVITPEQLGTRGLCPHCRKPVTIPRAEPAPSVAAQGAPPRRAPSGWLENSISGIGSLLIHMTILVVIALMQTEGGSGEGTTDDVLVGILPSETLTDRQEEQLATDEVVSDHPREELEPMLEIESPAASGGSTSEGATDLTLATPSPSGASAGAFDLGSVQIGGSMGGGSWDGMLQSLRRNGLDIVICFDSTGSMSGEIDQVTDQIDRIGTTLLTLVPKARISLCTYRDTDDDYVVRGIPLTSNVQDLKAFLEKVEAGGGGDHPEAVEEGLYWSMHNNRFRPNARKMILIFGDAPPHPEKTKTCVDYARAFRGQNKGIVSTVTCRDSEPLPEFYEIAMAGGGEAFLTTDQRQIMTQLMVLVFGSQHRGKVLEAFKMLER